MPMDPILKERWAVTLESGNYEQGRQYLRDGDNKCCCLGVLCDMVEPGKWKRYTSHGVWDHGHLASMLPILFQEKYGIMGFAQTLARLNDHGSSFKTIAKWIRKHL